MNDDGLLGLREAPSLDIAQDSDRAQQCLVSSSPLAAGGAGNRQPFARAQRVARYLVAWMLRRARTHARKGRLGHAFQQTRRLAGLAPGLAVVQLTLARLAICVGDAATARHALRAALDSTLPYPHACCIKVARLQIVIRDLDAAEESIRMAARMFPHKSEVWELFGELYRFRGDIAEAVACFEQVLELASTSDDKINALLAVASCFCDNGDSGAAARTYHRILRLAQDAAGAYAGLAECQNDPEADDLLVEEMRGLLRSPSFGLLGQRRLHYALARVHDRRGRHGEAFAHLKIANEIRARNSDRSPFSAQALRQDADAYIQVFTKDRIADLSRHGRQERFLVCVVGMPRSGTTLVEQILSGRPGVAGLGERQDIDRFARGLPCRLRTRRLYPHCCTALTSSRVREYSQELATCFRVATGGHSHVVTKLPEDYWHLGIIAVLFPNARIVHCRRHPIDTCLSCYMQDFANIVYSTNLYDLAEVYRVYRRLMQHWHDVLPPSSILDVSYERLVADPDAAVSELCAFCGIMYDSGWRDCRNIARRVDTASRWQVRRPIYRTSAEKWRNYAPFLGPLLEFDESVEHGTAGPD